jgi:CysZ protein
MSTSRGNFLTGAAYLLQGLKILGQPGLRRYFVIPLLINMTVFSLLGWFGISQFSMFLDWLLPESGWLHLLRWLLWPLFALAMLLLTFYSFTAVANLIAAPFNALLAEKVELHLTGRRPAQPPGSLLASLAPALRSELRKLGYFLLRALPLLLLFIIPGVNLLASPLWLLFNAWYLSLEYIDYPMGNEGFGFTEQHAWMRERRGLALGFGGAATLLMMIPILNFAAMPVAVAGATALRCAERETR